MPGTGGQHVETRLASYYFAYFCYMGAFGIYFPLWLSERGYSPSEIAAVLALPQLLRIFAPQAWAWLAERCGASRQIVVLSSALATAVCALLSLSSNLAEVFLAVGLMGILTSGVLPLVEATTLAVLAGRSGRYGPVRLWGSIGFIASMLGVGALLDYQPITVLIPVVVGLMSLAVAAAFGLPALRPRPADAVRTDWRDTLKQPGTIALFGACFCMMVAHGALFSFYTLHLVGYGYSKSVIGLLWTLGVVAEITAFACLPWLFQRYSYRTVMLMSFAAATVRFTAIGWGASTIALLAAAQLLHAFTFGTYHMASVALVHRLFPGPLEIRGQALYASLSYGLGGVCGGLLAGWTWQAAGAEATFTLSALFCAAGGAIVAFRLRESTQAAEKS